MSERPVEVDLRPTSALDQDALQELHDFQVLIDGPPVVRPAGAIRLIWSGIDEMVCVVRVREQGLLVSSLFVTQRSILVDGSPQHAGGVQAVQTHPEFRRRGLARAALQRSISFMQRDLQVELAVLFSSAMAVPLYESLGWHIFRGPVWCAQPTGRVNYTAVRADSPPMVLPSPGRRAPTEQIDMLGLPW